MKKDKFKLYSNLTGILGVVVIILSITLLTGKNFSGINRSILASLLQLTMSFMFFAFGIKENLRKAKSGRIYLGVGILIFVSAAFSIYTLVAGL